MVAHVRLPSLEELPKQQRTSTAAALRSGAIKISEPVPLENSGPSPVWTSSTSPFPSNNDSLPTLVSNSRLDDHLPVAASHGPPSSPAPELLYTAQVHAHGRPLRHKRSSLLAADPADSSGPASSQPRSSTNDSIPDAAMSAFQASKKRPGSIRLAFRKMFGKKDKAQAVAAASPASGRVAGSRHAYNKSESALMGSRVNLEKVEEDYSKHGQKRMESEDDYRPLTPMDAPRLPFPMNVNAPQPESPYKPGDGASPEARQSHKRRATLPSIALSSAEANALTKYWNRGEGGSPVSPLPRSDPAPDADHEAGIPAPLIGLAITSNTVKQKRRSRSADALHEMALEHGLADLPLRRRSAEIKYWRATNRGIPEAEELDEADAHRSFAATVQEVGAFSDDDDDDDDDEEEEEEVEGQKEGGVDLHPSVTATAITAYDESIADDEAPSRPESDHVGRADHSPALRAPTASPELATMDRVDQRLSQIELNMAQLAHSMQVLTVDRGLAAPGPDPNRRPSFKLEKAPAPKARSSLEQQPRPQSRRATPSLSQRDAASTTPANAVDSPASGGGNAGSPSPAVLVARSVSLKAAPSSRLPRAHHPRQSPSCTDLPVQATAAAAGTLSVGDQRSSAASHSVASGSPPPSRQRHHHATHHPQQQQAQQYQPRASPAPVLNFSNPFAPAHAPSQHHQHQQQQHQLQQQQQREREQREEQFKQQHLQLQQDQQHSPTRLVEHVAPLYAALAHERGARKRLEEQVGALRGDVAALAAALASLQQHQILQIHQLQQEDAAATAAAAAAAASAGRKGHGAGAGTRRSGSSSALGAAAGATAGYGTGGAVGAWGAVPPPRGAHAAATDDADDEVDVEREDDDDDREEEVLEVQELRDWKASRHRPATPISGGWIRGGGEAEGGWRESRGEESWREEIF